eukprot:2477002-Prymnesium_polylepis.1
MTTTTSLRRRRRRASRCRSWLRSVPVPTERSACRSCFRMACRTRRDAAPRGRRAVAPGAERPILLGQQRLTVSRPCGAVGVAPPRIEGGR